MSTYNENLRGGRAQAVIKPAEYWSDPYLFMERFVAPLIASAARHAKGLDDPATKWIAISITIIPYTQEDGDDTQATSLVNCAFDDQ